MKMKLLLMIFAVCSIYVTPLMAAEKKISSPATSSSQVKPGPQAVAPVPPPGYLAAMPTGHLQGTDLDRLVRAYLTNLPIDWDNPGQSFVSVGPYVNIPVQFSGNNLIINDPKINNDVALLKLRKAAHQGLIAGGVHTEEETHHSHLILSGNLEGAAQYIQYGQQGGNGGSGNNGSSSNINLSNAEINAFLLTPSPWVSAFMAISYEDGRNATLSNSRVLDSRLFLSNAFIIIGNFNYSSLYGTLGQMYVPFGTYSSAFASAPLTKRLARTKARAILGGVQQQSENAFYTALYTFQGDSHAGATSRINNGGINVGYRFVVPSMNFNGDIGAGWLGNIADSVGMQNTGNQPQFNGFGGPSSYGNEKLVHRVPAVDLRGKFSLGNAVDIIAEYVGATTSFNPNDLSFNHRGAKPWATNTEINYTFQLFDKPTSLGIGYTQAREALALGLPEKRVGAVMNTSIWHNTVQTIELRHDMNYAANAVANGSGVAPLVSGLGTSDNVITLQFDVYF